MAAQRARGKSGSSRGRGGSSNGAGSASRARSASKMDTGHLEGRDPSHDPDVFVDINKVHVDEIYVDVAGLPKPPEQGRSYAEVAIEKQMVAVTSSERGALPDQRTPGGVEHDG
jgi:hypothetical protein